MSSYGWLLSVVVVGFFVMCAFKIVPTYTDNLFVREALRALGEDSKLREMSKEDLKEKLARDFDLNGVRGMPAKSIKVVRVKERLIVNIDYEERIPLIYNIDVVTYFENQLDTANPAECCDKKIADVKK